MVMRTLAERLTHGLVLRRRLPHRFGGGSLHVSSEGGLRYLRPGLGRVDPGLLRLAGEWVRPGAVVWDIGANVGLFSFAAAHLAGPTGRVVAVEPDTWLVGLLRRSEAENRAGVAILPVAVSEAVGVARFHIARRSRSTNYLEGHGTTQTGGARAVHLVPTVTLDWLAEYFPLPDVVKIDVEEAEVLVLAGAGAVLDHGPVIICEVARANADAVRDRLRGFGYALYDADADVGPHGARPPLDRAPAALLAVPARLPTPIRPENAGATS